MTNEETIAKAAAFMAEAEYCVLALLDEDGCPTAATITPSKTEGIRCVIFGNHRGSHWAQRAGRDSRASVCFNSVRPECNVTLVGTMEIVTDDPALKKEMWREWMALYYSGPEDPAFCVLRFETKRYSLYVDGQQIRGTL